MGPESLAILGPKKTPITVPNRLGGKTYILLFCVATAAAFGAYTRTDIVCRDFQATRTVYDLAGRVQEISYHYAANNIDSLGAATISEQFEYDRLSRVSVQHKKDGSELHYIYYEQIGAMVCYCLKYR